MLEVEDDVTGAKVLDEVTAVLVVVVVVSLQPASVAKATTNPMTSESVPTWCLTATSSGAVLRGPQRRTPSVHH